MDEKERLVKAKTLRRQVLGSAYVDAPGPEPTKFQAAFRAFAEEHCWANVWIRPGLELRDRSMINLAILASLARWPEFEVHIYGALNNGITEDEIVEIILQAGVYAGIPIASEAFRAADHAVAEYRKRRETPQ
jgi:4-carboxymuconolactone decarboxylase